MYIALQLPEGRPEGNIGLKRILLNLAKEDARVSVE